MWLQFFEQHGHFAVYIFSGLVFLSVAWLYFDAWRNHFSKKELFKWTGFGLVGVSFIVQSLIIDQPNAISHSIYYAEIARLVGLFFIIAGQILDPLQKVPHLTGISSAEVDKTTNDTPSSGEQKSKVLLSVSPILIAFQFILPIASIVITWQYFLRATIGLERHLKKVAFAFAAFTLADLLLLARLFRSTSNPMIYDLVRAYGVMWALQHIALLVGSVLLGMWIWSYLTKRLFSQLFMIFILLICGSFLIISIGFTALLVRDVQSNTQKNLEVATEVLNYAFRTKESEVAVSAEQAAASSQILQGVESKSHDELIKATKTYLADKKQSDLIITDYAGQVLLRASDNDYWGDSLSSDPLIKRALLGSSTSGVVVTEAVGVPRIQIKSTALIRNSQNQLIGTATSVIDLDSSFLRGIQKSTGLESSLYAGTVLSATTQDSLSQTTQQIGEKLNNNQISSRVLKDGKNFSGTYGINDSDYIAAFVPVKDPDGVSVAMLSIEQSADSVLLTARRSIELTLILTVALLLISIIPVGLISRSLVRQLE